VVWLLCNLGSRRRWVRGFRLVLSIIHPVAHTCSAPCRRATSVFRQSNRGCSYFCPSRWPREPHGDAAVVFVVGIVGFCCSGRDIRPDGWTRRKPKESSAAMRQVQRASGSKQLDTRNENPGRSSTSDGSEPTSWHCLAIRQPCCSDQVQLGKLGLNVSSSSAGTSWRHS
jgi:hypothetical protein